MTTLAATLTARDTAGSRFKAAVVELRAAYIDLRAYDTALMNQHVGAEFPQDVKTFDGTAEHVGIPDGLLHPVYCTRADAPGAWQKDADSQAATYLANLYAG